MLVVFAVGLGVSRLIGKHNEEARSRFVETLAGALTRYGDGHGVRRPILGFTQAVWGEGVGIVLEYRKLEKPIAVPDEWRFMVGSGFGGQGADAEFLLMSHEEALPNNVARHDWIATLPPFRLVRIYRAPLPSP